MADLTSLKEALKYYLEVLRESRWPVGSDGQHITSTHNSSYGKVKITPLLRNGRRVLSLTGQISRHVDLSNVAALIFGNDNDNGVVRVMPGVHIAITIDGALHSSGQQAKIVMSKNSRLFCKFIDCSVKPLCLYKIDDSEPGDSTSPKIIPIDFREEVLVQMLKTIPPGNIRLLWIKLYQEYRHKMLIRIFEDNFPLLLARHGLVDKKRKRLSMPCKRDYMSGDFLPRRPVGSEAAIPCKSIMLVDALNVYNGCKEPFLEFVALILKRKIPILSEWLDEQIQLILKQIVSHWTLNSEERKRAHILNAAEQIARIIAAFECKELESCDIPPINQKCLSSICISLISSLLDPNSYVSPSLQFAFFFNDKNEIIVR